VIFYTVFFLTQTCLLNWCVYFFLFFSSLSC